MKLLNLIKNSNFSVNVLNLKQICHAKVVVKFCKDDEGVKYILLKNVDVELFFDDDSKRIKTFELLNNFIVNDENLFNLDKELTKKEI